MAATPDDVQDAVNAQEAPDSGTQLSGALSSLINPPASLEGKKYAEQIVKGALSGDAQSGEKAIFSDLQANAESARQMLRQARERLLQQQISPEEQRYAQAAAWFAPSRTGNFSENIGNALQVASEQAKQRRLFSQTQGQRDLGLAEQLQGVDTNLLNARLKLQEMHEAQRNAWVGPALRVLAAPTTAKTLGIAATSQIGKQVEDELGPGALQTPHGKARMHELLTASVAEQKARAGIDTSPVDPAEKADLAAQLGVPADIPTPWAGKSTKVATSLQESMAKAAQKKFDAYPAADAQVQAGLRAIDEFQGLNAQTHTGPDISPKTIGGVHVGLHGAGVDAGHEGGFNYWIPSWFAAMKPNIQRMDKLSSQLLTLAVPEKGFGRVTNMDMGIFQKGMLGTDKARETNDAIAQALKVRLQNDLDRHEFEQNFFQVHGHTNGAEAAWNKYLDDNPIFDPASAKSANPKLNTHRQHYQDYFAHHKRGTLGTPEAGQFSDVTEEDRDDPTFAGMTDEEIHGAKQPAKARGGRIRYAEGGKIATVKSVEERLSDLLSSYAKRRAMEDQGQSILEEMTEKGTDPQDVNQKFWKGTYWQLNGPTQRKFQRYAQELGFQPGDTLSTDLQGNREVARDWQHVGEFLGSDLPKNPEDLEGIQRGYVSLMHWANGLTEKTPAEEASQVLLNKPPGGPGPVNYAGGGEIEEPEYQKMLNALKAGATYHLSTGPEDRESPGANFGLEALGGAGTTAALLALAKRVGAQRLIPKLLESQVAKRALVGGGAGAIVGGASSQDTDPTIDILGGGTSGALLGSLAGLGTRYGTGAAGRLLDRVRGQSIGTGERKAIEAITSDNPNWNSVASGLRADARAKIPATLADIGPRTQGLAASALTKDTPQTADFARDLAARQEGANTRVGEHINQALKPDAYLQHEQDLKTALYSNAKPLYEQAYAAHPAVQSQALMGLMNTPSGQEAAARAVRMMQDAQIPIGQPDATGMIRSPSLQYLDYVKRALDDMIGREEGAGVNYQATSQGRILRQMRGDLVGEVDKATQLPNGQPGPWQQARAQYGGDLEVLDALRSGRDDFSRMTPEELKAHVGKMSFAERDSFRSGVAEGLFNRLGNSAEGTNPAKKIASTPALQEKLGAIFDQPGEAVKFLSTLGRESDLFEQSKPLLRAAGKAQAESVTAPSIGHLIQGRLMTPGTAGEIAETLSTGVGPDAQAKIQRLRAAADRLKARSDLGNTLGLPAAAGAAIGAVPTPSPSDQPPVQ